MEVELGLPRNVNALLVRFFHVCKLPWINVTLCVCVNDIVGKCCAKVCSCD